MKWEEAVKAMEEGHRVAHESFSSEEFFQMRNGKVLDEDLWPMDNWVNGEAKQNEGWSIV